MSAMDGPAQGPEFKGDPSSGGRKGGVISSTGIDPSATDAVMSGAEGGAGQRPGPSPSGAPSPTGAPAGGGQPQSIFEQPGSGFQRDPWAADAEAALPEDPDLLLRALYKKSRHPDILRLLNARK